MADLYCKVYVNTKMSQEMLLDFIANNFNGYIELRTVYSPFFEADVFKNEDADPLKAIFPDDGFLYYPYYLEIEPVDNIEQASYIAFIARLLSALWKMGAKAVAACDFEEELPNHC
ncbi:conserved hypothetical protein [Beggiatoa sp. PS]|nr:conserved hypothetical protein [Beggiatoa sp. PS]